MIFSSFYINSSRNMCNCAHHVLVLNIRQVVNTVFSNFESHSQIRHRVFTTVAIFHSIQGYIDTCTV